MIIAGGDKPNQDLPGKPKRDLSEGEYVPASGDISPGAHPGGIAPTEDPRKDAGLEEDEEDTDAATPKDTSGVIVPGIALELWAC